jgi:purine catabolism regulator
MPAPAAAGTPTLRALLARRDLRLRLAVDEADLDPGALDRPVRWVHSSDLADPTPFLSEGLALLTTGTQFADGAGYDDYVARLNTRGVLGLGFGSEVVREGIPPELEAACRTHRMPLFEVPYRTPFIAVARANAEAVAAEAFSRRSWALAAQRAVSLAALRPDGLNATLAELARRLDAWVGLFDAGGALTHEHPTTLDAASAEELAAEVRAVLRRGARAGSALRGGAVPFTLQTLGRTGHLRGVLAVGAGELDQEARGVVTAVVAMVELAFAQGERLAHAVGRLRTALLGSLLTGDATLTARISDELWGPLPVEPVTVAVAERADDAMIEFLDQHAGSAFFARGDDDLLTVVVVDDELVGELATRFEVRVGVSEPAGYDAFARARAQAIEALRRGAGLTSRFADVAASGVLAGIDSEAVRLRAEAVLQPLRVHDVAHGAQLEETLRVWLEHDARFDTAADALGVHRHTVRARVAQAARLLAVDLSGFPARAELWAALRLAQP